MKLFIKVNGCGQRALYMLSWIEDAEDIGHGEIGTDDGIIEISLPNVTGRHALFFTFETAEPAGSRTVLKIRNCAG